MSRAARLLAPWVGVAACILMAACSSDKPKPTPLMPVSAKIAGRQVWSAKLESIQYPVAMQVRDGTVLVAGTDGSIVSLESQSGREQWRAQVGARLSAGVGFDGRFAAVVTVGNELVVMERGTRRWSVRLESRTTTAPLVAGERVFVVGVDRAVHAFDALDGRRLWTYQRTGEALTLAQPAVLMPYKNTLVAGQGASLLGLDPTQGTLRWEVAVTSPRGTNEVERLNDLVGPALRMGDTVCARAFQTAIGCVNLANSTLRWSRLAGGQQAIGGDTELLFGADASDRITAWKTANGDLAWTNEKLLYRALSAPLSVGKTVVFGDVEGQVHFLDRQTGDVVLRLATDGSPVMAQPVLAGTTILVATRNGGIYAFRPD